VAECNRQWYFDITLTQAHQAHERRQWATLADLLRHARDAEDAPPLDGSDSDAADLWNELMHALVMHQVDGKSFLRAAVGLLLDRVRRRFGAQGEADPTPEALCEWLDWEMEALSVDDIDARVEDDRRSKGWPLVWRRAEDG
jgi:hypothetical protein